MREENEEEGRSPSDFGRRGCLLVCIGTVLGWVLTGMVVTCAVTRSARAQTVCCGPSGQLWPCAAGDTACKGPLGLSCAGTGVSIVQASACAAATPTPAPAASPTPTPTAPPLGQPTITTVKLGLPIPWTYTQGLSLFRGVLWGNAGNPTSGPNNGECVFSVDYTRTPPPFRVWTCSGLTPDTWETGYPKVGDDPGYGGVVVTWIETRSVPPWGQSRGDPMRYGTLSTLRTRSVDDPMPYIQRDAVVESGAWLWPLGWLHIGGQRMLYVAHVSSVSSWGIYANCLLRYYWPEYSGQALMDMQAFQPVNYPMASISDIAIDADGSLLATETLGDNATAMSIWRSRDEGRTWALATTVLAQPGGSLFDCHFAHGAGGAAQVPWLLTCNSTAPSGNWQNGGWGVVTVAWPGAEFPLYWGKAPAAQPQAMQAQAKGIVKAVTGAGPAPLSQLDVLRQLGLKRP